MNSYELSRIWFDWCFDNASKIRPVHTALFFFIMEHNNRLGWKKEFGLPRDMAMDAIGVKNNRTFSGAFSDLEEWGFIKVVERSKNQYSANIISLSGCVENTPATTKALDKAMQKHLHKHSIGIAPIDKHINIETYTKSVGEIEVDLSGGEGGFKDSLLSDLKKAYDTTEFLTDWNNLRLKHLKKASHINRIGNNEDLSNFKDLKKDYARDDFKNAMVGLFKQKKLPNGNTSMQSNPSHFLKYFNSYLTAFHDQNDSLYGKKVIETL